MLRGLVRCHPGGENGDTTGGGVVAESSVSESGGSRKRECSSGPGLSFSNSKVHHLWNIPPAGPHLLQQATCPNPFK